MTRIAVLACALACAAGPARGQVSTAYLIRATPGGVAVDPVPPDQFPPAPAARGLLVWADPAGDHWLPLTTDQSRDLVGQGGKPRPGPAVPADGSGGAGFSRSGRGSSGTDPGLAGLTRTTLLLPADTSARPRGGELVTPVRDSATLRPAPVVRRLPADGADKFPPLAGSVRSADGAVERKFQFPAGSDRVTLADLPPGAYTLGAGDAKGVPFTVESPARRAAVLGRADEMARTVGAGHPLATLYLVETLLSEGKPRNGAPAYLGDLLDVLESTPDAGLSPHLRGVRDRLHAQARVLAAGGEAAPAPAAPADPTGVPAVDRARAALAAGRYADAAKDLAAPGADPRAVRLAGLYRAVLLAEGGAGSADEAEALFDAAVMDAESAAPDDRFRVHANCGQFYHRRAQDRLNAHSLQIAAGVTEVIATVVRDWASAKDQYDRAVKAAPAGRAPAVALDLARLYALLGDLVRTLDAPADLAAAAGADADKWASAAAADPANLGIACEVRALTAFRRGDLPGGRKLLAEAADRHTADGFLAGAEAAHKMLGQLARAADDRPAALRHLLASHLIAELLRDRLPADQVGRTRAGFFARRAFVLDGIVELHLAEKRYAEALGYAELAKARAFTDQLAADGVTARPAGRPLADVLRAWPKSVAAVEYFLARDKVWAFVVTVDGAVKAFPLAGLDGGPPDPQLLLDRVRRLVAGMEGTNKKMMARIMNDRGFDNAWEEELSQLRRVLLPDEVLAECRRAETVLIAPQHVLHYLPFAALVVTKDESVPGTKRVAKPRFLVDEKFVTVNVPSVVGWDALRRRAAGPGPRQAHAVGIVQAPGEAPLEGVAKDLANLRTAFGAGVRTVLEEDAATPAAAAPLFARRGLLLLATHGYNDADKPLESFLVLHPGAAGGSDGRVRARDVYRSTVRADVVVMSACYTGLGDRSPLPGDDLFGLQRSFLQAGGRAVVAGLWDVYDGTAPELVAGCFTRLGAGVPAARAVKEAQRAFLDTYRAKTGMQPFVHPYFWAVYTVLGDDQARLAGE